MFTLLKDDKVSVEVSQRTEFSCSYLVPDGKYYKLNSHHYKFEATVCGAKHYEQSGIVISFEDFKDLITKVVPDGFFLFDKGDIQQQILCREFQNCGVPTKSFSSMISAERLLEEISLILVKDLRDIYPGVYLKETKLRENSNSYVSWKQEVL